MGAEAADLVVAAASPVRSMRVVVAVVSGRGRRRLDVKRDDGESF